MANKKRTGASTPSSNHSPSSTKSSALSTKTSSSGASSNGTEGAHGAQQQQMNYYPKKIGYLKRCWIWYEGTFAISMLEPWEKILLHSFAITLLLLTYLGIAAYLPGRVGRLMERVKFYLYGAEGGIEI